MLLEESAIALIRYGFRQCQPSRNVYAHSGMEQQWADLGDSTAKRAAVNIRRERILTRVVLLIRIFRCRPECRVSMIAGTQRDRLCDQKRTSLVRCTEGLSVCKGRPPATKKLGNAAEVIIPFVARMAQFQHIYGRKKCITIVVTFVP